MGKMLSLLLCICAVTFPLISHARDMHHHHHHESRDGCYGSLEPSPPPLPVEDQAAAAAASADSPAADPPTAGSIGGHDDPVGVFNVMKYGAVGDSVTDDTEAFKQAWEAACEVESGIVLIPRGYSFMIQSTIFAGPCKTGLVFQVEGSVVAPDGPEAWPENMSKLQWLVFYRLDGFSLQGGGLIDGRGEKWWNLPCKPHRGVNGTTMPGPCDSPTLIRFFKSSNLTVKQLMLKNSPMFHFKFDLCEKVYIDSLFIRSPALSPNTDGIHIQNTNNVGIYNSDVSNGDDCVSIGPGCYDVDIRNVTCGQGHGISIGSLGHQGSKACVRNITVRDSQIKLSANGLRIKTWQGGSGSVTGVTYTNIRMEAVRNPIMVDQFYCLSKECANMTSAVSVSDVSYSNIKGTYDMRSPPFHFGCSDSVPCTNITLSEVELLPAVSGHEFVKDPFCWNVYGRLETMTIPPAQSCLRENVPAGALMDPGFDVCG